MIASSARPDNASIVDAGRRAVGAGSGLSYLAHFGLSEAPFRLTPDTDFFFASPPHREALNTLLYALENGEGFIKIVGAVGTGKTLLCRMLLASLPANCQAVYLPNPALDPAGILLGVAEELGISPDGGGFGVHKAIQSRLLELAQRDIHVVLILDEAQAIPADSLEALRLLSNLETEKRKLLTIVLFGQPELDARLNAIPQLKTRISFHERLRALDRDEMRAYLDHRLEHAAQPEGGRVYFTPRALRGLHRTSGGEPRVANVIAHKALLLAYGRGLDRVGWREVRLAARDTADTASRARGLARHAGLAALLAGATVAALYLAL
ncbi:type II secretory pathway component ATPase [Thiobacillus denitrificans ATCC 25259]|uniref:Type II secretory pathway component ATPase n=1 Tax=Thiobacillus denitrificans (strain ATCC 25259 / T1) TaxID=292415 RepID=Q3SKQ7_THIDA|nr:AAA family ATPase [Thiobacillus denitrificans]AAZ96718.1 type II secretory pathway component ATPase [Thiobacillus denitrificans ATCC 25259]